MTTTPLDKEILQEIVRIIRTKERVPDTVEVGGRRYALTYLEDHSQRLNDALASRDANMLSILFGQLASKVKYQVLPQAEGRTSQREPKAKRATVPKIGQHRKTGSSGRASTARKSGKSPAATTKARATKQKRAAKLQASPPGARRKK